MKTMNRLILSSVSTTLALGLAASCSASAGLSQPEPVDPAWLAAQKIVSIGTVVSGLRIRDSNGEHVLVLARQAGPSPSRPKSGRVEHIELRATFYVHAGAAWNPEWTIHDVVDCPNLDSAADFFPKAVTFTDLNSDGRVETTVAYHMFCGGGIDTHTVKVILREGATKLAIRGESRMFYPGQEAFGGEHQYDKALLQPDRAAYKRHMDRIWEAVSVFRYR
jgi:hypothetical protein